MLALTCVQVFGHSNRLTAIAVGLGGLVIFNQFVMLSFVNLQVCINKASSLAHKVIPLCSVRDNTFYFGKSIYLEQYNEYIRNSS